MAQNKDGTWDGFPFVLYQLLSTNQHRLPDYAGRPENPNRAQMRADIQDYLVRQWPLYFCQRGKPI